MNNGTSVSDMRKENKQLQHDANKLLLVDDDALTLTLLSTLLEHAGYQVTQAHSGEDAFNIAMVQNFDLALLDINMPGMSGLELAKRLKAETDIPFMFLSAMSNSDIVKQAVDFGAVGYLVKPLDTFNLIPTLEAGLARAEEISKLKASESNLTNALAAGRETNIAVGILMNEFVLDRHAAFEILRTYARSNRRSLIEVATELLDAEETFVKFKQLVKEKK